MGLAQENLVLDVVGDGHAVIERPRSGVVRGSGPIQPWRTLFPGDLLQLGHQRSAHTAASALGRDKEVFEVTKIDGGPCRGAKEEVCQPHRLTIDLGEESMNRQ